MPEPLPRTHEEFRSSLAASGLPRPLVDRLVAQARPALLLVTQAAEDSAIPLGASKLGGWPDLPADTEWPRRGPYADAARRAGLHREAASRLLADARRPGSWISLEDAQRFHREYMAKADSVETTFPLSFISQLDLAALAREKGFDPAFPSEGRLLLFYDFWERPEEFAPESSAGWQLIWDRSPIEGLVRTQIPPALQAIASDETCCVFRPARIDARTVITPMPVNDHNWDAFPLEDAQLLDAYKDWLEHFGTPDVPEGENHQLGGFPRPLQNGLQSRNQLASNGLNCGSSEVWQTDAAKKLLESAGDWQLALQFGVDENAGIPGPGACYVMMRAQDIAAQRFDLARITYQCD